MKSRAFLRPVLVLLAMALGASVASAGTLLNVSYDVTREFYKEYNPLFIQHWKETTGETLEIKQSHGGSSKQARAVADGLAADVVTFNQASDLDFLAEQGGGLVAKDWAQKFPHHAAPLVSTIVFVVRKGNPHAIKDWADLLQPGLSVVIPNPKTSGNGRYSYLAAWGFARGAAGDEAAAKSFVTRLFKSVPVLDTGGRGATTTFAQRGIGDVLLTFENEAHLIEKELGTGKFEIVLPSVSILAEAPVAVVEKVVDQHGTRKQAEAYLQYLYSPAGQELAAKHHFRPSAAGVVAVPAESFPPLKLLTIDEIAGGWTKAIQTHFADGGLFDQIYSAK